MSELPLLTVYDAQGNPIPIPSLIGPPGPNRISELTTTNFSGLLKGSNGAVATATAEDIPILTLSKISDAAAALAAKAPLVSPGFTGAPTAPTAAQNTNSTQIATTEFVINQGSLSVPLMDGVAASGSNKLFSKQDHVHPTDTSRAPLVSPAFTGTPTAPTAAVNTNTTQLATTAFVIAQAADANPVMNGVLTPGVGNKFSRYDHVHPSDTTKANVAGQTFTGVVIVPAGTDYVTYRVRNIALKTSSETPANGDILGVYS